MIGYEHTKYFRKTPWLIGLLLLSVNQPISLGQAGKQMFDDASRFHKSNIKKEVKELIKKGYLKEDEPGQYKCNFEKIVLDVIRTNQEIIRKSRGFWKKVYEELFGGEIEEYECLIEFWNDEKIKKVFFDRNLVKNMLKNNPSKEFFFNSFAYLMELPIFLYLHSEMMRQIENKKIESFTAINIVYHLFRIEEYVKELKNLEPNLYYFITHRSLFEKVITLHKKLYRKGKKVFQYIEKEELTPQDTDLKFMTDFLNLKKTI